jgi:thiamine pyrophosphate-dependent acetolactate synthase large subunit-like protein
MELDTYKRFNLNIMTVVVNNSNWGMSSNGQDLVYGADHFARPISALSSSTEYDVVAKGLQNAAAKVSRVGDIRSTVTKF